MSPELSPVSKGVSVSRVSQGCLLSGSLKGVLWMSQVCLMGVL